MTHLTHLPHLCERETLARANQAILLGLVGGGLAVCAFGAAVYDVGRWVGTW